MLIFIRLTKIKSLEGKEKCEPQSCLSVPSSSSHCPTSRQKREARRCRFLPIDTFFFHLFFATGVGFPLTAYSGCAVGFLAC